jgi:hypothetical protein
MTRDDKVAIISLIVFVAAGAAWFYFHALQTDRYKVTSFCRPRGYIGGFIREGHSLGCVARNGKHVLISDIEREERNAK